MENKHYLADADIDRLGDTLVRVTDKNGTPAIDNLRGFGRAVVAEDHKQYVGKALATESKPAKVNLGPITLHMALNFMVAAGDAMDQIKRAMFYGPEKMDKDKLQGALSGTYALSNLLAGMIHHDVHFDDDDAKVFDAATVDPRAKDLDRGRVNLRLLHAAIGHFTESSEKIRALLTQYETGELDAVNYGEELGDGEWYAAIEYDELGLSQTNVRQANLNKLAKRNKGAAFNAEATTTGRDVAAEREILEAGLATA